jgi:uncharacterized protein YqeY
MLSKDQIQADLHKALKERDAVRASTLRMLIAAIKNREIDVGHPLDEAALAAVITSGIKQRRESIEGYTAGGRPDLVAKEETEVVILQAYLPPPMEESEVRTLVDEAVRETGASSARDIGAVMKWLMPRVAGRADGKVVNVLVRERLK